MDGFAPGREFRVRILDLSGALEDRIVEEVDGFVTLMHANAFARAYVRDSVERCRLPGASGDEVLQAWRAFGEDAELVDAGEQGWHSEPELDEFASNPGTKMECDWRALDPRLLEEAEDDDAEPDEEPDLTVVPRH